MKRLYSVVSIAITIMSLVSPIAAEAIGGPRIAPNLNSPPISSKIAKSAKRVALKRSTVGWCYRGVKRALSNVGIMLTGSAAWMAKDQLRNDKRFVMVPFKKLKAGDILVHGRNSAHPYGHIAVYLGNNLEASDHVQKLVVGRGYGTTHVFRAKDHAFTPITAKLAVIDNTGLGAAAQTVAATLPSPPIDKVIEPRINEPAAVIATEPDKPLSNTSQVLDSEQQIIAHAANLLNLFCLCQLITVASRLFV